MGINIDFKMLPMKVHYFLYNAGTSCVVPFMPVFARQLGFSTLVVGTIYSILPILGLVSKPLFGALADRYQRHKSMFIFFIILTIVSFSSIQFIPSIPKQTKLEYHCSQTADLKFCPSSLDHCAVDLLLANKDRNDTGDYIFDLQCEVKEDWIWDLICQEWENSANCRREESQMIHLKSVVKKTSVYAEQEHGKSCLFFTTKYTEYTNKLLEDNKIGAKRVLCPKTDKFKNSGSFKFNCTGKVNDENVMNLIMEPSINDENATSYSQFWYLFIALAISWIGMAVVVSVGDAICFDLLGKRSELYGNQRLWGAVGFGIFNLLAGFSVDLISGNKPIKNYSVIYYLMAAALLPNTLVSSCLEFKPNKFSSNIIKDIGKLFKSARVVIFFLWCVSVGLCTALIWNFLFWYLEDLADQKGDCNNQERMKTLQGLVTGVQNFGGDLPFFFISGWFLRKVGYVNTMTLVLFTFGVRLTLYSVLSNPWWVLPIEFSHGMTSGIFYATMASYANIVAPSGTAATLQGLVGAIFEGIGVSAGSFVCGYLMNIYGGSVTFRIFGIAAICLSFVHYFVQKFLDTFTARHDYRTAASVPNDDFQMLEDDNDFY